MPCESSFGRGLDWLAQQCVVIPISDAQNEYACQVRDRLFEADMRAEADLSDDTMKYKIRAAQTQQVPYMLVVGERERESGAVAVRHRRKGDIGIMARDAFIKLIQEEIAKKTLDASAEIR